MNCCARAVAAKPSNAARTMIARIMPRILILHSAPTMLRAPAGVKGNDGGGRTAVSECRRVWRRSVSKDQRRIWGAPRWALLGSVQPRLQRRNLARHELLAGRPLRL